MVRFRDRVCIIFGFMMTPKVMVRVSVSLEVRV